MVKNKRIFLFVILSNIIITNSFAQDPQNKNKWNIKLSYANYRSAVRYGNLTYGQVADTFAIGVAKGNFRMEGNYYISKYIEAGVYTGILQLQTRYQVRNQYSFTGSRYSENFPIIYGVNLNFHLLPLLIKKDNFRFDIYATSKLGGVYFNTPDFYPVHGNKIEYSLGGGFSFYFSKHLGLFTEYCFGKFSDMKTKNLKYGITLQF